MLELQSRLIFPVHSVPQAGPPPANSEPLTVQSDDGQTLRGIFIPADEPDDSNTLLLGFGGNAWNGQDVAEYLHELYPGHDVVAFHYRGYPPSTGEPSAKALIADAPKVYDAAVARAKPDHVIALGFSIGTGIAAQLAARRKLGGLVLVTPFDSLRAVAQSIYPWLPIGPLFAHEIDAATPLGGKSPPVAIIAAQKDEIIATERTDALRKRVSAVVFDRTIAGAGHNDIYSRSDFHDAMHEALDRLKA